MTRTLTTTIWPEDDGYVSICTGLDIASQGDTVEEASANLQEAVDLFFGAADASEVAGRLKPELRPTLHLIRLLDHPGEEVRTLLRHRAASFKRFQRPASSARQPD